NAPPVRTVSGPETLVAASLSDPGEDSPTCRCNSSERSSPPMPRDPSPLQLFVERPASQAIAILNSRHPPRKHRDGPRPALRRAGPDWAATRARCRPGNRSPQDVPSNPQLLLQAWALLLDILL